MLNDLLYSLKQSGAAVENVVYLGAGTCPDFHRIKELQPARIVLVEANKQYAAELRDAYGREENLIILENLVVADEEESEAELLVTNLPAYSSILEPSCLSQYYPNVRVARRDKVPVITLPEICSSLAIGTEGASRRVESPATENVLIVDLPGYDARLLASVPAAVLGSFDLILCRAAAEAVYTGAEPLRKVEQTLHRRHFLTEVVRELAYPFVTLRAIPDKFARLCSELDHVASRNELLEQRLESVQAELRAAQDAREAVALEHEQLQADNAALRAEKEELSKSNQIFSKTLLKAQTDLDDLRRQYRDLKQAKARQNGVMMQVAQRLERASEQYVKLVEKYPELRELGEAVLVPMVATAEGDAE